MSDVTGVRADLERRLEVLLKRVQRINVDLRKAGDRDWQERAIELENDDVLEGLDEASRAEVAGIRSALSRIDAGTYGLCARCGVEIGQARLAALPSATTCVACAGG